jgi:hypothetical protein
MKDVNITYIASKTGAKYHKSKKVVRGFMGPVGNGKTVASINEMHKISVLQAPNDKGIRLTRWAVVRNTYQELRTTTLKTFEQWMPEEVCGVVMNPLITGNLDYPLSDGTRVKSEFIFLALDREVDVKKLLGIEVTGVFINEAREIHYAVIKAARERIGRYPSAINGYIDNGDYLAPRDKEGNYQPCTRKCILMDTNPPDDDHWWYQLAEEGALRTNQSATAKKSVSEIFDFFRGPAPLIKDGEKYTPNPLAENINHLPGGYKYYLDMIAGNTADHVNIQVLGNYGSIITGQPVYPQYNDRIHCPEKALGVVEGIPVGIGWDFGLTPTAVFGQLTPTGQLRVFAELTAERMGIREFARDVVLPWIVRNLDGIEICFSWGDPSAVSGKETYGHSAIGILNDKHINDDDGMIVVPLEMGFITEPASTNSPVKRIDAVSSFMTKMVDSGSPGYLLSKKCKVLRKGKCGGYHYKKVRTLSSEQFQEKPNKNEYSHSSDAEQYLALGFIAGHSIQDDYEEDDEHDYSSNNNSMGY